MNASTSEDPDAAGPGAAIHRGPTAGRGWLLKGAAESALIVFSVVLALFVDGWRESRARADRLAEAQSALLDELRLNQRMLASDAYLPHHQRLHAIYDGMERSGTYGRPFAAFENGVHVPLFADAAWSVFLASDVANGLPFATRATLADIYAGQEDVQLMMQRLLASLSIPRSDRANPAFVRDMVLVIDLTLTDVVIAEARLLKQYDEALVTLTAGHVR